MGDPRRSAWMCSPAPRPWGFSGNFSEPNSTQHQTCLLSAECPVEAWTAGSAKPPGRQREGKKQKPDRLVYPRFSLPSIPLPLAELRKVAPNAIIVWSKHSRCLKSASVSLFFSFYFFLCCPVFTEVVWSISAKRWAISRSILKKKRVNIMKQKMKNSEVLYFNPLV